MDLCTWDDAHHQFGASELQGLDVLFCDIGDEGAHGAPRILGHLALHQLVIDDAVDFLGTGTVERGESQPVAHEPLAIPGFRHHVARADDGGGPDPVGAHLFARLIDDVEEWDRNRGRSEEHTSELQSLMRISYAVSFLNKKNDQQTTHSTP